MGWILFVCLILAATPRGHGADEFRRQTGYPHGRPGYIVDHVIPLARGGCDCPDNMQWQTLAQSKCKDSYEQFAPIPLLVKRAHGRGAMAPPR